jgi:hypothetical protein
MTVVRLPGTRSKYGAKRQGGHASIREDKRAWELKLLEKDGTIRDLREQVRFQLLPPSPYYKYTRPFVYVADFVYCEKVGDKWVQRVEDCKGFRTDVFKIKKRLMAQLLGIDVTEV